MRKSDNRGKNETNKALSHSRSSAASGSPVKSKSTLVCDKATHQSPRGTNSAAAVFIMRGKASRGRKIPKDETTRGTPVGTAKPLDFAYAQAKIYEAIIAQEDKDTDRAVANMKKYYA